MKKQILGGEASNSQSDLVLLLSPTFCLRWLLLLASCLLCGRALVALLEEEEDTRRLAPLVKKQQKCISAH